MRPSPTWWRWTLAVLATLVIAASGLSGPADTEPPAELAAAGSRTTHEAATGHGAADHAHEEASATAAHEDHDHDAAVAQAAADGEISLNVSGAPLRGKTSYGAVRGLLDGHSHMMIDLAFGENGACGRAWSPQGPSVALQDCPDHKVAGGAGAYAFNLFQTGVSGQPTVTHSAQGWPNFDYWPAWNVVLHQQVYYRWLERAWRAGLRVFVMDAVDLAAVCDINIHRTESCDETENVLRQLRDTYALQDYIDQRAGGPGKGWFRIVTDPFQARKVINQGKLAVVLGIETSELFGCSQRNGVPQCDRADIDAGLDQMQELGVTSSFVCHKFDNALCGVAMDKDTAGVVINSLQYSRTGRFWDVETCTGPAHDEYQVSLATNPFGELVTDATGAVLPAGVLPVYPKAPHCNKLGLTELGEYFVRGMIKRGMIVEVDHMSVRARRQTLNILEAEDYSGVIASHSWSDPPSQPRILRLGGMATPMAGPASSPDTEHATPPATCCYLDTWQRLRNDMNVGKGRLPIGFADDMSGPSPQPTPRADGMPEVRYPFRSFDGGTLIDRQHSGTKAFDINTHGVAHFGLFPDWWERLRLTAGQRVMDDLAAGAEGYLQMWERAAGMPDNAALSGPRLDALRLGVAPETLLRRAGQPDSRPLRSFRYRVDEGRAAVTFNGNDRAELIVSTAEGHRVGGIRPGASVDALDALREVAPGVFVRPLSDRAAAVYVTDGKRVTAVAVAAAGLTQRPTALRQSLRLAGIR